MEMAEPSADKGESSGMLPFVCRTSDIYGDYGSDAESIPVSLVAEKILHGHQQSEVMGIPESSVVDTVKELVDDKELIVQLFMLPSIPYSTTASRARVSAAANLFVVIYGRMGVFDRLGEGLQNMSLYLQDPVHCDRNVEYRNPHRLDSLDEDVYMTFEINSFKPASIQKLQESVHAFETLESTTEIVGTPTPALLRTELYSHQKKSLTFMLRRERGWMLDTTGDVWQAKKMQDGRTYYENLIMEEAQFDPPPEFRGGLLADPMGLGKSLSMIALIASDLEPGTTLLVVPPSILGTWQDQLSLHLQPNALKWCKYHGANRSRIGSIENYNIVLTTYQTVSAEWKRRESVQPLFDLVWYRIVLDEAHIIRHSSTSMAQATYSLKASRKWVMTGTPFQNHLSDLASLFRFLGVFPFSNTTYLRKHGLLGRQIEENMLSRVTELLRCIGLRRPKSVAQLPARQDELHPLDFTIEERDAYQSIKQPAADALVNSIAMDRELRINLLSWISSLRMVCNLGVYYSRDETPGIQEGGGLVSKEQKIFEDMCSSGTAFCSQCSVDMSGAVFGKADTKSLESEQRYICTCCLHLRCGTCHHVHSKGAYSEPLCCTAGRNRCFRLVRSDFSSTRESCEVENRSLVEFPTKVKAVLADLSSQAAGVKSLIFSFWTSTLSMVAEALKSKGMQYLKIDGRLPEKSRAKALDTFKSDADVTVLLISISCGAVGLDLTAATRVYLMEPQWNPMLEEQALDRVHRIGQTKPVTTIRYIIRDSIEENVRTIQEQKKNLAEKCVMASRDSNQSQLQYFKDLVGIESVQDV